MDIAVAQREVRQVYRGGFVGQMVSGLLWLASAVAATYGTAQQAIVILVVGGFFIFPLTTLGLRLLGGPWKLNADNPFKWLGMQVAFVLPLSLPLVAGATTHRLEWFYPSMMIILGAHYLPFMFLYGMRMFGMLSAVLVAVGIWLAHGAFAPGGWITGALLLAFAVVGLALVRREGLVGERPA